MIRRIRLGFVVVICVVLQTTLFTHLRIEGVAPELGLVGTIYCVIDFAVRIIRAGVPGDVDSSLRLA